MNQDRVNWTAELSETYGRMVYSTAYRILGNPQDAEDVLQEVFLKLLGGWSGRVKSASVRDWGAYLRVSALRTAIDLLRKKPKLQRESWELAEELEAPSEENPRSVASQNQKARLLRRAIGQLPERDAKVFAMRCFEDFSYEEIAAHLGINVNQVGVILHRARERLQEILLPHESSFPPRTMESLERSERRKEISHVEER